MDPQATLLTFLTITSYMLPLCLVINHLNRDGWKFGPAFYTGLVACLATIAMTARVSSFLEIQLAEPDAGWFTKATLIALFTCFLAAISISVFGWAIPSIKRRLRSIPEKLSAWWNGNESTTTEFNLSETENKGQPNFLQAGYFVVWNLAAIVFTFMLIFAYVGWPSIILTIDQHKAQGDAAVQMQKAADTERAQQELRSYALFAGSAANELITTLRQRQTTCKTDRCTEMYQRRLDEVSSALSGWGLSHDHDGLYRIGTFVNALQDRETASSLHVKIKGLSKKWGITLPSEKVASLSDIPKVEPSTYASVIEQQRAQSDTKLAERLVTTVTSPSMAIVALTHDLTMAFALAMEFVAIVLTFLLPDRKK